MDRSYLMPQEYDPHYQEMRSPLGHYVSPMEY
jgi:hypothetical protein